MAERHIVPTNLYHFLFYDMPDKFVSFMRAEWIEYSGFCDVKKVSAINSDGSSGFVKVSRYISKYIAKPKDICPWISEGIVEAPRRLSSRDFGTHKEYISQIKSYYRCEKLDLPNFDARLDRIIDRTKTIVVDGVRFPFPRRIKEKLFYNKTKEEDGSYRLKKSALQELVVARQRDRIVAVFNGELQQSSFYDVDETHHLAALEVASRESAALAGREARSSANLLRKLRKDVF